MKNINNENINLLGLFTRTPKGLGWEPSYMEVWQNLWEILENGELNQEVYGKLLLKETELLKNDCYKQKELLSYWPEFNVNLSKINKNSKKNELKKWLKEIAYINHLGPYKGWLFQTNFSSSLEIKVGEGFRSIHPEKGFTGSIPNKLFGAVNDKDLQEILEEHQLIKEDGKSQIYTYKVNKGEICLPTEIYQIMLDYAKKLNLEIGFSKGGTFTVDYMLSEENGQMILQPIELHLTPLGIIHDFKNIGAEDYTKLFANTLAASYQKIMIYTNPSCMNNGFYSTEINGIANYLKNNGCQVLVSTDPNDIPSKEWFVFPYNGDFKKLNGEKTTLPTSKGIELESKSKVNELLKNSQIGSVIKPKSQIITKIPSFYNKGKTFVKPKNINKDLFSYKTWKEESQITNGVVIKPIEHHHWSPQILNLNDINDGKILFKYLEKYDEIIVEEMVKPNLILGNGEIRVFYQVN